MKSNMKKYILFITILFTANSFAQDKLTLKDCLSIGIKNSKELAIANSKIVSSSAKIDEVNSQFLPQLKLNASYSRLSDVPPFEITVPFSPKPIQVAPAILNNYNFRLSVQQPVFTGFKLSSLKNASKLNNDAAREDFNKEKNELAVNIHNAFWNYYKSMQVKNLMDENLQMTAKHIEDTKNFMNQGLATLNDLLKLQVQQSSIKLQQIDARNNVDLSRTVLNKTIGLPLNSSTDIIPEEPNISLPESYNLQDIIIEAKNNRSELKSLNLRIEAGKENVDAVKSAWYPSVYVSGNYYYSNPNQRYQPPIDQFKGTWDLGISLSWDIWNWGNTKAQTTQAEQSVIQSTLSKDQLKDAIELEVNQNYLAYTYNKEKLDVSRTAIQQAEENYRITEEKYKQQLATSTDLIDAETSLLQANTNFTNSVVDFQLAKIRLLKSLGRAVY